MSEHRWKLQQYRDPQKERVARRFRHHVQTASNPRGRIVRPIICQFCAEPVPAGCDAHHVDYTKSFIVVWCCFTCHRQIERGAMRILLRHIYDYSSLVRRLESLCVDAPTEPEPCPSCGWRRGDSIPDEVPF